MHLPGGDSVTVLNGEAGWLSTPGRGTREMGPSELFGASVDAQLFFPSGLKQFFKVLRSEKSQFMAVRPTCLLEYGITSLLYDSISTWSPDCWYA